jgi:uncharacterized membrane protein
MLTINQCYDHGWSQHEAMNQVTKSLDKINTKFKGKDLLITKQNNIIVFQSRFGTIMITGRVTVKEKYAFVELTLPEVAIRFKNRVTKYFDSIFTIALLSK